MEFSFRHMNRHLVQRSVTEALPTKRIYTESLAQDLAHISLQRDLAQQFLQRSWHGDLEHYLLLFARVNSKCHHGISSSCSLQHCLGPLSGVNASQAEHGNGHPFGLWSRLTWFGSTSHAPRRVGFSNGPVVQARPCHKGSQPSVDFKPFSQRSTG